MFVSMLCWLDWAEMGWGMYRMWVNGEFGSMKGVWMLEIGVVVCCIRG